jgi:hypothetical protein
MNATGTKLLNAVLSGTAVFCVVLTALSVFCGIGGFFFGGFAMVSPILFGIFVAPVGTVAACVAHSRGARSEKFVKTVCWILWLPIVVWVGFLILTFGVIGPLIVPHLK